MKTKTVAMAALLGAILTSPIVNAGQFCINGTMEKRFGRAPGGNLEVARYQAPFGNAYSPSSAWRMQSGSPVGWVSEA